VRWSIGKIFERHLQKKWAEKPAHSSRITASGLTREALTAGTTLAASDTTVHRVVLIDLVHRFHHPGHEKEFPDARELGMTRFLDPGAPEWPVGEAKFLHIWQLKDGSWKLTRVVSYDH
jgi:hypothetical protein